MTGNDCYVSVRLEEHEANASAAVLPCGLPLREGHLRRRWSNGGANLVPCIDGQCNDRALQREGEPGRRETFWYDPDHDAWKSGPSLTTGRLYCLKLAEVFTFHCKLQNWSRSGGAAWYADGNRWVLAAGPRLGGNLR